MRITVAAAQKDIVAGDSAVITAAAAAAGQPEPHVRLRLLELAAGQAAWQQVAAGTTDSSGELEFTVPDLTTNASFRVSGPHRARSPSLSIVVTPPVSVSVRPGPASHDLLAVSAPLAKGRDIVELEVLSGGSWHESHVHRLRDGKRTAFSVVVRKISRTYRVVLLATPSHGQSVSGPVTIAGRARPAKPGAGNGH